MNRTDLAEIIELSHQYGQNPDFVLAGGGNTSVKDHDTMYVKASGQRLADIQSDGFVALNLSRLFAIMEKEYPSDEQTAEAEVLADMLAARMPGENGRPSVEALLHALFPQKFVVHLHPSMLNGLTCARDGEGAAFCYLGEEGVWLDATKPGYTLAIAARKKLNHVDQRRGTFPSVLLLQNHGVFFAAETKADMIALIEHTCEQIRYGVTQMPQLAEDSDASEQVSELESMVRAVVGADRSTCFFTNVTLRSQSEAWQTVESCSLTPDHIVYLGHAFCCVNHSSDHSEQQQLLEDAICAFHDNAGYLPKIIIIRGVGAFACADTQRDAETYRALFLDALKITVYARNFGGVQMMSNDLTEFIRNWEVERYRQQVFSSGNTAV